MVSDCAALAEGEIARALQRRGESKEQLSILELGFGSGSLTSLVLEWVRNLNRPFEVLDDDPPVRRYEGWDRAPQMVSKVRPLARGTAMSGCQVVLTRTTIWPAPTRRPRRYDVIFGSLIFHFMVDATAAVVTMGEFFGECVRRLRPGGSLVLADVFPADDGDQRAAQLARWSDWMCGDEGGLEPSEVATFLEGNQDMVHAPSPERVIAAALAHGLT